MEICCETCVRVFTVAQSLTFCVSRKKFHAVTFGFFNALYLHEVTIKGEIDYHKPRVCNLICTTPHSYWKLVFEVFGLLGGDEIAGIPDEGLTFPVGD